MTVKLLNTTTPIRCETGYSALRRRDTTAREALEICERLGDTSDKQSLCNSSLSCCTNPIGPKRGRSRFPRDRSLLNQGWNYWSANVTVSLDTYMKTTTREEGHPPFRGSYRHRHPVDWRPQLFWNHWGPVVVVPRRGKVR